MWTRTTTLVARGWYFVQLCTANKVNIRFEKMKSLSITEVTPEWVCYRRALGFSVLIKKLQQVLGSRRGYMYNAPSYMFIYADGNCISRFDAINKISSGISLINSCCITGSHETHKQLCNLLHNEEYLSHQISVEAWWTQNTLHLASNYNKSSRQLLEKKASYCLLLEKKASYCLLLEKQACIICLLYTQTKDEVGLLHLFKDSPSFTEGHGKREGEKEKQRKPQLWSKQTPFRE